MTTKNHKDTFDDYSNLFHKDSIANDVTLEDCHTNVLPLADISKLKWKCFRTNNRNTTKCKEAIKADLVLKAYSLCISENYICLWRRIPSEDDENDYPRGEFTLRSAKELWVFWFDKREPRNLASYTCDLVVRDEYDADHQNQNDVVRYDIRCLLFRAIHNLIERSLFTMGQKRFGKWFVATGTKEELKQSMPQRNYSLAYGFSFFVHGDIMVCATINIQRQPLMCRLDLLDYFSKKSVPLILGPHGIRATLVIDQIEYVKKEVVYISNKYKRDILVAKQYNEIETIAEEQYNDWRGFYPLPVYDAEDIKYRIPTVSEILPRMTLVEIDNLKILWPTEYIGIIMDEYVCNGDRKCFYEKLVDEDQEVATIMANSKDNFDTKNDNTNNRIMHDIERVDLECFCRHHNEDIDQNGRIFEETIISSEYAVLSENTIQKPSTNISSSSPTKNIEKDEKFENAMSFLKEIDNELKKEEAKQMEIDDDDDIEKFLNFDSSIKTSVPKSPDKNSNENKNDKVESSEKKDNDNKNNKNKNENNEEEKEKETTKIVIPKNVEPAIGSKWRYSNYCGKVGCICPLCFKLGKLALVTQNKKNKKNEKYSVLQEELMMIDEGKENEPIYSGNCDVKSNQLILSTSYESLIKQRLEAKTTIPKHPIRLSEAERNNLDTKPFYSSSNFALRDYISNFQSMKFGDPKIFQEMKNLPGYNTIKTTECKESFPKFTPLIRTRFEYFRKKKYLLARISHKKGKRKIYHTNHTMSRLCLTPPISQRNRLINRARRRYTFPKEDTLMARDVTFYDKTVQRNTNDMLNSFINCIYDINNTKKYNNKLQIYKNYEITTLKIYKENNIDELIEQFEEKRNEINVERFYKRIINEIKNKFTIDEEESIDLDYLDPFKWHFEGKETFESLNFTYNNEITLNHVPEYLIMNDFLYVVVNEKLEKLKNRSNIISNKKRMFPISLDNEPLNIMKYESDKNINNIDESEYKILRKIYDDYLIKSKEDIIPLSKKINSFDMLCENKLPKTTFTKDLVHGFYNEYLINELLEDDEDEEEETEKEIENMETGSNFDIDEFLRDADDCNSIDDDSLLYNSNKLIELNQNEEKKKKYYEMGYFEKENFSIVHEDDIIEELLINYKTKYDPNFYQYKMLYENFISDKDNDNDIDNLKNIEKTNGNNFLISLENVNKDIENKSITITYQKEIEDIFKSNKNINNDEDKHSEYIEDFGEWNDFFTEIDYEEIVPEKLRPKKCDLFEIYTNNKSQCCHVFNQILDEEKDIFKISDEFKNNKILKKPLRGITKKILENIEEEFKFHENYITRKYKNIWKNVLLSHNFNSLYIPPKAHSDNRIMNTILNQENFSININDKNKLSINDIMKYISNQRNEKTCRLNKCFERAKSDQQTKKNIMRHKYDRMHRAFEYSNRFFPVRTADDTELIHMMFDYEKNSSMFSNHNIPQQHNSDYFNHQQAYNSMDDFHGMSNNYHIHNSQQNQGYFNDQLNYQNRHNNQYYNNHNQNAYQNIYNNSSHFDNFMGDDYEQMLIHNNSGSWNQLQHTNYHSRNPYQPNYHQNQSNIFGGNTNYNRNIPSTVENDEEQSCSMKENEIILKSKYFKTSNENNLYYHSLLDKFIGYNFSLKFNFREFISSETSNTLYQNQYYTLNFNNRIETSFIYDYNDINNPEFTLKERKYFTKKFENQICIHKGLSHVFIDEKGSFKALQYILNNYIYCNLFNDQCYYNCNIKKYTKRHYISEPVMVPEELLNTNDNVFISNNYNNSDNITKRRKLDINLTNQTNINDMEIDNIPFYLEERNNVVRKQVNTSQSGSIFKSFPCTVGYSQIDGTNDISNDIDTWSKNICKKINDKEEEEEEKLISSKNIDKQNIRHLQYKTSHYSESYNNLLTNYNNAKKVDENYFIYNYDSETLENYKTDEFIKARYSNTNILFDNSNEKNKINRFNNDNFINNYIGESSIYSTIDLDSNDQEYVKLNENIGKDFYSLMTEIAFRISEKRDDDEFRNEVMHLCNVDRSLSTLSIPSISGSDDSESTSPSKYDINFAQECFTYNSSNQIQNQSDYYEIEEIYDTNDIHSSFEDESNDSSSDESNDSMDYNNSPKNNIEEMESDIEGEIKLTEFDTSSDDSTEEFIDSDLELEILNNIINEDHFQIEYCEKKLKQNYEPLILCRELQNNWSGYNLIVQSIIPRYKNINDIYQLCIIAESQELFDNLRDSILKKIKKLRKDKLSRFAPDYYKIMKKVKDYGYTLPYETYILYREGPVVSYSHYLIHNDIDNFIHLNDCECCECLQLPPIPNYIDLDDSTSKNPYLYNYRNPKFIKKGITVYNISSSRKRFIPPMMPHHNLKNSFTTNNKSSSNWKYINVVKSLNDKIDKTVKNKRYYECGYNAYISNEDRQRANAAAIIEVGETATIKVLNNTKPPNFLRLNNKGHPVTRDAYERLVSKKEYFKMKNKRLSTLNFKAPKIYFFKGYDSRSNEREGFYNSIVSSTERQIQLPDIIMEESEEEEEHDDYYELSSVNIFTEDCPILENNADISNNSLDSTCNNQGLNSINPLTPGNPMTPLTPQMTNPLTPSNSLMDPQQGMNALTPNPGSISSSGPPSNYMNPGSNSYSNPGSNSYPNPGSNSYSNPASNTYPNPGSNNSVLQSIISQPNSQVNQQHFIPGNISSPSSFHSGNQMPQSMMASPIMNSENQFLTNPGNYHYNRQINQNCFNPPPMRENYNTGMFQNINNQNIFLGNDKHNVNYSNDGTNTLYEHNQYNSNMNQISNTDTINNVRSDINSGVNQIMSSHYNSPIQQFNSGNNMTDRNSQQHPLEMVNHQTSGNMNQGYINSSGHHMISGNQHGNYNNQIHDNQYYNKIPNLNYENNGSNYINNRNLYGDENNPNEISYDSSSYNNNNMGGQMNVNQVSNNYQINYGQNNFMDCDNNVRMYNNDDHDGTNIEGIYDDINQQNNKNNQQNINNSPMPLLYNESNIITEPSIIDSNTEYNCLYYKMEPESIPPASSLLPVETEKLSIDNNHILPMKSNNKIEIIKKDIISRREIKKDSIGISLLLHDSVFELYYDIIFDGCPICSCNSNIMSDDYGMYLRPPGILNKKSVQKSEWSGFYLAGDKNKCKCGFSALRHKLFSYNSGLFKEDAEEGSGLGAIYEQHPNRYHKLYNKLTEYDLSFINLFRIQSLNREMGAQINSIQSMLTKCLPPLTNAISNKYLNKCSNYMFSQVDINEKEHAIYNSLKASIEDDNESHLCIPNRNRKLIDYPSFLHPWSIQFPNNAKDASDADCYIILNNVSNFFKTLIHNTQCFGPEKRDVFKTFTWSELVKSAIKSTKVPDEYSYAPEPIPSVILAAEKDLISCAPQIVCSWEKLALSPIDQPKDVLYFAITPDNDFIIEKTKLYFHELSKIYENYKLGRHIKLSKDIVEDGIFKVPIMTSDNCKIESESEKEYYNFFNEIINDKEYLDKMKSYAAFIEKQVYQFFEYNDILFDRRAFWECVKHEMSGPSNISLDTSSSSSNLLHNNHDYILSNYPSGYYDHCSPSNMNRSGTELDQQRTDSPIKDEDMAEMPHIIVIYIINPFNFGLKINQPEQPKFALISIMRAFNVFLMKLNITKRFRIQLEIINLQSIMDFAGYLCDKKRNERWYAPDPVYTRNKNFKFSAYEQLRSLSFAIYTHSRIYNTEDVRYVLAKSVTKFGYTSTVLDHVNEDIEAGDKIFKLPCNLYRLSSPKRNPIQMNGKSLKRHIEDTVLFVSYCLVEDKWLVVTVSDHLGYLLDNCLINLQVIHKDNEIVKYKKGNRILDAISRLWVYIMGVLASETRNWRIVIGRFGRVGHTELKAWMHILSKTNIKRYNTKIKEACNLCAESLNSQSCPIIVSACFVSMEAEHNLRLFNNAVAKFKVLASASSNIRSSKQKVIHSPDDVSVTHILVFPTTVDLSIDLAQGKDGQEKDDFESLVLDEGNDEIMEFINNGFINDDDGDELKTAEPDKNTEENFFNIDSSDVEASNQPMAIGYYISTAPTGKLPNWFWSQCPKAKDRCPVHLRNSLHIVTSNILQSDELMLNFKNTESTHPLDSTATDDVLRYVLKTYNALSWLNVDCVTSERRSCLPIHIQALARLCNAVETFMF
ncbi:Mediator of RNA polymerase II transcription subunit 13 [Strongyloides ratti]|uniref:Mediator of RNA polymerase II transcription subunit 13 n=1 Tax=Strongyloides ratti TaxID=34506 RepID=A0A090N118_STRRB|nr:Mediator of RNA polymerase II transcription subunit 13 [Strongyloides ratti]CEF71663.1 Mediator of RNA polymerase II transcription subunit 13 [Strongyloides ratti]